eukprot:126148-Amphidinium_carterae.1
MLVVKVSTDSESPCTASTGTATIQFAMEPAAGPGQRTARMQTSVNDPACASVAAPSSNKGMRAIQGFVSNNADA